MSSSLFPAIDSFYNQLSSNIGSIGINVLAGLGMFIVAKKIFSVVSSLYTHLPVQFPHNLANRYGKGTYALITGANRGIGYSFCESLIERGFNLVILGRNEDSLKEAKKNLTEKYPDLPVKIEIIVADLAQCHKPGFFDEVEKKIKNLDVSILVNNAAVAYSGYLINKNEKELLDEVIINGLPSLLLTKRLLRSMIKRDKRSACVFMSSLSALQPMAGLQAYSAVKLMVDFISDSLDQEYGEKIDFLHSNIATARTNMIVDEGVNKGMDAITISPKEVVEGTLVRLGKQNQTYATFVHYLISLHFSKEAQMQGYKNIKNAI